MITMRSKCQIVRCKPIYSLVKCVLHKIYIIFSIWYQITECLTCCTAEVEIQQLTTLTGVPGLLLGVSLLLIVSSPSTLRTITILTSPLLLTVIIIITYKLLTLLEISSQQDFFVPSLLDSNFTNQINYTTRTCISKQSYMILSISYWM